VDKLQKKRDHSKLLRERAERCRRLADGVCDAQFARTLASIAGEFEALADLTDRELEHEEHSTGRHAAEAGGPELSPAGYRAGRKGTGTTGRQESSAR
jgi:hypothetical protein